MLQENDFALERGIIRIYENQTQDEQRSLSTKHNNGEGFNGTDATFFSSLAQQILNSPRPYGKRLSPRQREIARKHMGKYWRQLQEAIG